MESEKITEQTDNKEVSSGTAVPFLAVRQRQEHPYALCGFDSPLWEVYWGAYGNVVEYLMILMGEREEAPETFKLRRLDNRPKTNYEMAFDNLCENLWHQMDFYQGTWLALPYLAKLMERWEKEKDKDWLYQGIMAAGGFLATDVYEDKPEAAVYESYQNAILQIRDITIDFLAENMDDLRKKDTCWKRELAAAVTAVLGEQKLAYMFLMSNLLECCYIVCPECENCDEEIEFGYNYPSERIEKAEAPSEKWDGKSFTDVKLWLFNLFELLEDREGQELLCYYFGTYICPECGERIPVLRGMEEYFLSE